MDFDDAIAAHVDWKAKLRNYIKLADKSLNPNIIEQDNQCALGKWIYGEGSIYKSNLHYEDLRNEHAEFHKCAAKIVRHVDSGKLSEAEAMINANSNYTQISMTVVTKIRKMRDSIGSKK